MSSIYGSKLWQKAIALIIIISIPTFLIYYDYVNDPIEQTEGTLYSYEVTLNETVNQVIFEIEDLPSFTDVNFFINYTNLVVDSPIIYTLLEPSQYNGFLANEYPLQELNRQVDTDGNFTGWVNYTIAEEGLIRAAFTYEQPDDPITINGFYNYLTEGYVARNLGPIIIVVAIYVIFVFAILPNTIKNIRVNRLKRRKEMERIQEEEEFYRKHNY